MNAGAILIIAVLFWWLETSYFGWNVLPQSPAEVICDGIVAVICALAFLAPR